MRDDANPKTLSARAADFERSDSDPFYRAGRTVNEVARGSRWSCYAKTFRSRERDCDARRHAKRFGSRTATAQIEGGGASHPQACSDAPWQAERRRNAARHPPRTSGPKPTIACAGPASRPRVPRQLSRIPTETGADCSSWRRRCGTPSPFILTDWRRGQY